MIQAQLDGYLDKADGGKHESNDGEDSSNNSCHLLSTY